VEESWWAFMIPRKQAAEIIIEFHPLVIQTYLEVSG
jgi:hypothetical protein